MEYLQVNEAQRVILEAVASLSTEQVKLEQSLNRVLAEEVRANRDQPPYDISAMDGYALRSADSSDMPATLQVVDDIKAGDMPSKILTAGQCARIMTGAPLPQGADAVIRVEDTEALADNLVQINLFVKPGNDIRRLGENMRNGEVVLAPGTEITPGVIGVLATVKRAQVQVYRRPRVAILSTGNELEGLDEPVDPNRIPNSNSYALMGQVQALGIEPVLLGIARDDPDELARYLRRGLEFDVLLVSGGTSVGVHDYVRPTIEALGAQMLFWRVSMKPGHPVAFGKLPALPAHTAEPDAAQSVGGAAIQQRDFAGTIFFGLPGNPVSSMVCFEQFVVPALRRMMGHARSYRRTIAARMTQGIKHQPGRTEFIRVTLAADQDGYTATSTGPQGSGMLLSMAKADGLAVIASDCKGLAAGDLVTVQLLDGTEFQHASGMKG